MKLLTISFEDIAGLSRFFFFPRQPSSKWLCKQIAERRLNWCTRLGVRTFDFGVVVEVQSNKILS